MAGSKNKKKIPKQNEIPNDRQIKQGGNPCAFYDMNPSWRFHKSDPQEWSVDKENLGDIFWDEILPRVKDWDKITWKEILNEKKDHHPINVDKLTKKAQKRLEKLHIEAEAVYSLRFKGTHRLYGLIENGVFNVLWFDKNHGDNDGCVCQSHKKHT